MILTTGPNGVLTAVDSSSVGTRPWVNITGVYVLNDNQYASGTSSYATSGAFAAVMKDFSVRLWQNGIPVGSEMAQGFTLTFAPPFPDSDYSGTWGMNLTYKDVNSPEFGVAWAGMISGTGHAPQFTHYMVAKNFGFDIPTGSIVVGVAVRVFAGGGPVQPPNQLVMLLDYIDMQINYTNDYSMQGVDSVTAVGQIVF